MTSIFSEAAHLFLCFDMIHNFKIYKLNLQNRVQSFRGLEGFKEAEEYKIKMKQVGKGHPQTYYILGGFYTRLNRYEDAEWLYLKAIEIKPDYIVATNSLIGLYIKTNQFQKGLDHQKKLLEKEQNNLFWLAAMEILYFHLGDLEKAEKYSKRVDEILNEDISQANQLAVQYHNGKNFERAVLYFNKAMELEPDVLWHYYNQSCGYALMGKTELAIDWLSQSINKGYDDFNHIHTDADLKSIRDEPAFKTLMEKHFPGQVLEGEFPIAIGTENTEPIYFQENCILLADYYESEGEHERAKWLREKAAELEVVEGKE